MKYQIVYEKNPKQEDVQILNYGIMLQAKEKKGMKQLDFFAFFIRDENGKILGGCVGDNMYGCFYVGSLWVTEELRGKGLGTELMQKAEVLAKESGCHFMSVNTFDWEALDFYKKLGFIVEFERKGFDKNSIFYFLRKDFNKNKGEILRCDHEEFFVMKSTFAENEYIDNALGDYNISKVPFTQENPLIFICYNIKDKENNIIGGIKSVLYGWGCLFIDLIWVADQHRGKGLGSCLINKVEEEALKLGCHLIHLDTFDFQAKDFYLKKGYEIFGILDDCPKLHKRFYLKKKIS